MEALGALDEALDDCKLDFSCLRVLLLLESKRHIRQNVNKNQKSRKEFAIESIPMYWRQKNKNKNQLIFVFRTQIDV